MMSYLIEANRTFIDVRQPALLPGWSITFTSNDLDGAEYADATIEPDGTIGALWFYLVDGRSACIERSDVELIGSPGGTIAVAS